MDNTKKEKSDNSGGRFAIFMANVLIDTTSNITGPLVDDGAPYSGHGLQELLEIAEDIMIGWNGNLNPLPEGVRHLPYWCSAMCLAGREHSPTGKQKEEHQKQPLPMARATERSTLPFPLGGLPPTVAQLRRGCKERCPAREENGGRDL